MAERAENVAKVEILIKRASNRFHRLVDRNPTIAPADLVKHRFRKIPPLENYVNQRLEGIPPTTEEGYRAAETLYVVLDVLQKIGHIRG